MSTVYELRVTARGDADEPSDADIELALENAFEPHAFSARSPKAPPTREQIAEARQVLYDYADRKITADAALIAVLALLEKGATP